MDATAVDLRYRTRDLLAAVGRGETVTVHYRGRPVALLAPIAQPVQAAHPSESGFFGMWADRTDLRSPTAWVRNLRQQRRHAD
jgi:antitoxin (DNA-binding transcriptional repressor) of toxin-antitoxin stability system